MFHMMRIYWDWNLVRTETTLDWCSFPCFRSSPSFRNTGNQDRVNSLSCFFSRSLTSFCLDLFNFFNCFIQFFSEQSVCCFMIIWDCCYISKDWFPTKTFEEESQFFICFPFKDCWVMDLPTIEIEDWKNSTIIDRVQESIWQPTSHQWSSFPFTITNYCRSNDIWIIQYSSSSVWKCVTKFSTFVDRSWCFRRRVWSNSSREWEDLTQVFETFFILRNTWIQFSVWTIQVWIRYHYLPTMTWSFNVEHIQVVFIDGPVQVSIDKVLPRYCTPVSDWVSLQVVFNDFTLQQRVIFQVHLSSWNVVGCTPPSIYFIQVCFAVIIDSHLVSSQILDRFSSKPVLF